MYEWRVYSSPVPDSNNINEKQLSGIKEKKSKCFQSLIVFEVSIYKLNKAAEQKTT